MVGASNNGAICVENLWFSYEVAENIGKHVKILKDGGCSLDAPRQQYDGEIAYKLQLKNVTCEIPYGGRVLLLGANGAGKSTFLNIIGGKHMVDSDSVRVLGRPAFHDTTLSKDVALLTGNWTRTVNFVGHGVPYQAMEVSTLVESSTGGVDPARVQYLMDLLEVDINWNLTECSDGQRRRVQIFCKLVRPFKLLLLDEITTDLDLLARQNLMKFLKEETENNGVTVVYCTHIFDGMDGWATHAIYLAGTEMQFCKPTAEVPELSKLSTNGHGVLFTAVQEWLLERAENFRPLIVQQSAPSKNDLREAGPSIVVNNLTWQYKTSKSAQSALDDVNCSIPAGSRVLLVGANGSGKTTLLKLLGGKHMIPADAINVLGCSAFHDTSLNTKVALLSGDWSRTVACVGSGVPFQADFSFGFMANNELAALKREGVDPVFLQARFDRLTTLLDMDMEWRMNKVSDGQRRRAQLLLKLLRPCEVLLMDEVTTDLDLIARQALLCFLREESELRGVTVVYATHIFDGLDLWPTHLLHMQRGKVAFNGSVAELPEAMVTDGGGSGGLFKLVKSWLEQDLATKPVAPAPAVAAPAVALPSVETVQAESAYLAGTMASTPVVPMEISKPVAKKSGGSKFDRFGSSSQSSYRAY